tara:strand:- start:402 stop:893 length:492 start_codon:yes stop_codon:yes gene_type:complete
MLIDIFGAISDAHKKRGFTDYKDTSYLYNACQTHFYQKEIMLGTVKYEVPLKHKWFNKIDWPKLWTDKWVRGYTDDPGVIDINDMLVKDQYYDYAKACMPYIDDPDLDRMVQDAISKLNLNVYTKKPPAMVYMIGAIENKDNEEFVKYYNLMIKNIEKINNLG